MGAASPVPALPTALALNVAPIRFAGQIVASAMLASTATTGVSALKFPAHRPVAIGNVDQIPSAANHAAVAQGTLNATNGADVSMGLASRTVMVKFAVTMDARAPVGPATVLGSLAKMASAWPVNCPHPGMPWQ